MTSVQSKAKISDFANSVLVLENSQWVGCAVEQLLSDYKEVKTVGGIKGFTGQIEEKWLSIVELEDVKSESEKSTIGNCANELFVELFTVHGVERIIYVATCIGTVEHVGIGDTILTTGARIDPATNTCVNLGESINSTIGTANPALNPGATSNLHLRKPNPGVIYAPTASLEPLQAVISAASATDRLHVGMVVSSADLYHSLRITTSRAISGKELAETANTSLDTQTTAASRVEETSSKCADLPPGILGVDLESAALFTSAVQANKQALSLLIVSDHTLKIRGGHVPEADHAPKTGHIGKEPPMTPADPKIKFEAALRAAARAALC